MQIQSPCSLEGVSSINFKIHYPFIPFPSPEDFISQLKAMMEENAAKAAEKAAEKAVQAAIAPITAEMRARKLARREDDGSDVDVTDDEMTEEDKIQQEKTGAKAMLPCLRPRLQAEGATNQAQIRGEAVPR